MGHLEYLVRSYGYWALFVGVFFEGETILVVAGILAKIGLLRLPVVMVVAFVGSFCGDQLWFYIGYLRGQTLLAKHPKWERRVDRIHKAIKRYRNVIMLGFRFVYGMRIMAPFVLGLDKQIKLLRFTILNAIGAALWAVSVASGGYLFGYALERFMKDIRRYEIYLISGVILVGLALWAIHRYRSNRLE